MYWLSEYEYSFSEVRNWVPHNFKSYTPGESRCTKKSAAIFWGYLYGEIYKVMILDVPLLGKLRNTLTNGSRYSKMDQVKFVENSL